LDDKESIGNAHPYIEKEENVAVHVEGLHNTEDDNVLNSKANIEGSPISNRLDINSQSPISDDVTDISALVNDDDETDKEDGLIKRPQHISSEPSTPDELIEDWERLHHKLPNKLRKFALKVAAIHLDKDDDSRGVTVKDIGTLSGCKNIDAAEARKDNAVDMGLLVPHTTLKEGKQKLYFLSNYMHIVNERLKRKSIEAPASPEDISLAFIKVLSSRKCAYHHISMKTSL
jgi:hypothetical protein